MSGFASWGSSTARPWISHTPEVLPELHRAGIYEPGYFLTALRGYLDLPIKDALHHENPIIQALALADRRLGRRSFASYQLADGAPEVIQAIHAARKAVFEGR